MAQETIVGYLDGVEQSGNKVTFKVKKHEKRDFPDWYIGWFPPKDNANQAAAPDLKPGRFYKFICDVVEREKKDKKGVVQVDSNGNPLMVKYYNYVSSSPATERDTLTTAPPAPRQAQPQASAPRVKDDILEDPEWGGKPKQIADAKPEPGSWASKESSIERQCALKAAVELEVALISKGEGSSSITAVLQCAEFMLRFLQTGNAPTEPFVLTLPAEEQQPEGAL